MKRKSYRLLLPVLILILSLAACSVGTTPADDLDAAVTATMEALATISAATLEAADVEPAADPGGEPAADTEPADDEAPPAEPTPRPEIIHTTLPSSPGGLNSYITDRSSETYAPERRSIGDNYDWNIMERPFTSSSMDYQPHLDIIRAELSEITPWIYITIFVEGEPPADSEAYYSVEIDLDLDGRGDWLITGMIPANSEWTTDFVQVFRDSNEDVGGTTPMRADPNMPSWDGYDELVFDQGLGNDPDAAWIRRDPAHPDRIQLAFKYNLIGGDREFLWGVIADEGLRDPGGMDYNDVYTIAQAGSPTENNSNYPLQQVASLDNTCRWTYDFTPTMEYIGMCALPATPTPEPTGSISGYVYRGGSSTPSSERMGGVTVMLGQGSCTSSGYRTAVTNRSGYYEFTGLPAGTYCVTINSSTLPSATYGWGAMYPSFPAVSCPPFNPYQGVTIGPNENRTNVNFAFMAIVG